MDLEQADITPSIGVSVVAETQTTPPAGETGVVELETLTADEVKLLDGLMGVVDEPFEFYSHRSGAETYQHCPRRRYLHYHHLGTGVNLFPPIYFDIGTAVHAGLAHLMGCTNDAFGFPDDIGFRVAACQMAIDISVEYFRHTPVWGTLDEFSRSEQVCLISTLLWAFYYRAWPTFIRKFEVLFVEEPSDDGIDFLIDEVPAVLHLLSRPDVIVRDRKSREVVAINWKTINDITQERRDGITNSLQVNLEAYYAELLYSRYMRDNWVPDIPSGMKGQALAKWLKEASDEYSNREHVIDYTQIVYLEKGPRVLAMPDGTELEQDELQQVDFTNAVWRQQSPLCYKYVNLGDTGPKGRSKKSLEEFPAVAWATRYYKLDNVSYNLLGKDYVKQPVWETSGAARAIQLYVESLNAGEIFPSTMKDPRNAANPLDKIIVFDEPIYRNRERQIRFREQIIEQEMGIAKRLINRMEFPDGNLQDYLDQNFPQHLISCRKPTKCEFDRVCNAPMETQGHVQDLVRIEPGGIWQARQPHHAAERQAFWLDGDTVAE